MDMALTPLLLPLLSRTFAGFARTFKMARRQGSIEVGDRLRIVVVIAGFLLAAVAVSRPAPLQAQGRMVDLALVLAVDISGSIDDDEAALQRKGYVHAFRDKRIIDAIRHGRHGAIAVTYIEWAGHRYQRPLVNWTVIDDAASANDFADALAFEPITINVWTSISGAIAAGMEALRTSPYKARRRVIDISGDGANNDGVPVTAARDRAVAAGIGINGLPIVNNRLSRYGRPQIPNLDLYYADCVIGGPGAFLIVANGFDDYARAVRRKLILEIAGRAPGVKDADRSGPNGPSGIISVSGRGRSDCLVGESLRQDWDDDL